MRVSSDLKERFTLISDAVVLDLVAGGLKGLNRALVDILQENDFDLAEWIRSVHGGLSLCY